MATPRTPVRELADFAAASADPLVLVRPAPRDGAPVLSWCNPAFTALTGYLPEEIVGRSLDLLEGRDPDGADGEPGLGRELVALPGSAELLRTMARKDGSRFRTAVRVVPVGPAAGSSWALSLRVSSDRLRVDARLRASEERFKALADQVPVGIFASDVGLRLGFVNARMTELFGHPVEACIGTEWLGWFHPDDVGAVVDGLHDVLLGTPVELALRITPAPGVLRWVQMTVVPVTATDSGAGFIGTMDDVTDRRAFEDRLRHQATHDPLTELPNRVLLLERTELALAARPGGQGVGLFFLDLDDFKLVNDSLGHASGDQLLEQVAARLRAAVREGDLVARVGGDEFVVLCPDLHDQEEALQVATRLRDALLPAVALGSQEVSVTASVGVVLADGSSGAAADLLRDADVAMYQAKSSGRGGAAVFDLAVRGRLADRLHLQNDLRRAVESGSLHVVYQPVVALADGRVTSVEALARWQHPTRGAVPPTDFIPLAEQSDLITKLGADVLRRSCRQLASWRRLLGSAAPETVSVNLSAVQLRSPRLVALVGQALDEAGLEGSDLCLELTESVLMHDPEAVRAQLQTLRSLGVHVAMDDFGTGYSSLAYLEQLPVDRLKIDRSLLRGLGQPGSRCLVPAAVALARGLELATVAEGVESDEQLTALRETGCTHVQGYHVCRPLPGDEVTAWLREHATRTTSWRELT